MCIARFFFYSVVINTKDVDRVLSSLERTETGFLLTLEDAQNFIPEGDGEDAFLLEEDLAMETFQSAISTARDLADQLLTLKSILSGLADFSLDLSALQDSLTDKPESNLVSSLQELKTSYSSLREEWRRANLPNDHPLKQELNSCMKSLTGLGADVATAKSKSDSHSTTSSTSSSTSSSE